MSTPSLFSVLISDDELDDTAEVDWVRVFDATSRASSRTTVGRRVVGGGA